MKKYLFLIVTAILMAFTLIGCGKMDSADKGNSAVSNNGADGSNSKEIISTSFSYSYEMTNWQEDDMGYERPPILYVTYNAAQSEYVQIDCSEWFNPNTYISIQHPMTSGDYWMSTYSEGGSTDYRVKVEIGENSISITEYGTDGELAEYTAHFKKVFS